MDYSKGWYEGMSLEDTKNLAYYERNMLALLMAIRINQVEENFGFNPSNGWYFDTDNNWDGWKRVISLDNGQVSFHIPDSFDIGSLQMIASNWNGHTTEEKWNYVKEEAGILP